MKLKWNQKTAHNCQPALPWIIEIFTTMRDKRWVPGRLGARGWNQNCITDLELSQADNTIMARTLYPGPKSLLKRCACDTTSLQTWAGAIWEGDGAQWLAGWEWGGRGLGECSPISVLGSLDPVNPSARRSQPPSLTV